MAISEVKGQVVLDTGEEVQFRITCEGVARWGVGKVELGKAVDATDAMFKALWDEECFGSIEATLEHLRDRLREGNMSMGEMIFLQGLADRIEPGDMELLEAAGVPEFADETP